MNTLLSLLGSALLLSNKPSNNDFVFCLMKNTQTIDINNQCSHFAGDLHRNCMDFMNSPFNNECLNELAINDEINSKWSKFIDYMVDFKKVYHSNDELHNRYNIFHDNLEYIEEHNRDLSHTYKVGINRFADMSHNEYKEFVKSGGLMVPNESNNLRLPKDMCGTAKSESGSYPSSVDWREKGAVTPVRDQKFCGSCWAHSGSEAVESAYFIKTGILPNLSVQQLVDCSYSYGNNGCNGGWYMYAWTYANTNGITTESAYPYTATSSRGSCQPFTPYTYVSDCKHVPANELQLTYAVAKQPVSVAIEADSRSFQLYIGGIYSDPSCGTNIDHAVVAIGYSTDSSGQDYWTVRNSWGTDWGMDGYILIARNSVETSTVGQCAIATYAAYPIV
jgi:C1A family cysteine protease